MISLQSEKSKSPTRVLSDIATENNMKFLLVGSYDENITEQDFNKIVWIHKDEMFVTQDHKSLPSPVTWAQYKERLDAYLQILEYTYQRSREYPSIQDQLDTIFHQGIDAWKEQIQAIKDKYPKPA